MTARYAEGTSVTPERSQMEISALLRRYGADGFAFGWETDRASVGFKAHGRQVRFTMVMPDVDDEAFRTTPTGRARKRPEQVAAHEAEVRRRWRALALAIKAKLEAVATGIASFEDEFLAYTVLPGGATVADVVQPEIDRAYISGVAPLLQIGGAS